ncbi:MAG: hypothetical protein JWQ21_2969 [Herminiimonas sp.]|nr:hypothetical protein [Herminiimonas sp.]
MSSSNYSDKKKLPEQAKPGSSDGVSFENFAALRYPPNPKPVALSALAIDWILYLPSAVRPNALGKQYPRIANALAEAWNYPEKFEARLEELTCDNRGDRQGFPDEVAIELANLKKYYETVSQQRSKHSAWDSRLG